MIIKFFIGQSYMAREHRSTTHQQYANGSNLVVIFCGLLPVDLTYIIQGLYH